MAGPTVNDLVALTDEIAGTDELYLLRGTGAGADRKTTGDRVIPTVLTQNTTTAINLNTYKGDLVIFSTPAAAITLTLNNMLPNGRRLIIVNKSTDEIITLAGNGSGTVLPNDQRKFVSDATNLFDPTFRSRTNEISANYVILDNDGYDNIEVTTAATNRTVTLPTLADNLGRVITITKMDAPIGKVIVDGEGAETINSILTLDLWNQYDSVKIIASSSEWKIITQINEEKENLLINGNFRFAQEGASGAATFTAATTPANNDDTYLLDQCILLSDGNDIVDVSQDTSIPGNRGLAMKSLVATIDKKWGFFFPIESTKASELQDKKVSLSFYARTTTGAVINNLRAAVMSWDGAADAITSDVVAAWNAAGADITPVANWTIENTPANLALVADVYTKYTIEGVDIDTAGTTNVGVFIWVDDTDGAINDEMFLAEVALIKSDIASPAKYRTYEDELIKCQRFWEKSFDIDVAPGAATVGKSFIFISAAIANTEEVYTNNFKVTKRDNPTVTIYSTVTGATGQMRDTNAGADEAVLTADVGMGSFILVNNSGGGVIDDHEWQWTANSRL